MVPYLEMGGSNVFSVKELKVPMVPYLEMVGSKSSLFSNGWFQCFFVKQPNFQWFPI